MEVIELTPGELVRWRVTEDPPEWIGTIIDWRPSRHEDLTVVNFTHQGWVEPVELLAHCSTARAGRQHSK